MAPRPIAGRAVGNGPDLQGQPLRARAGHVSRNDPQTHEALGPRVLQLNSRIRNLAGELDIHCVDLEKEFNADCDLYYEIDGLHPTTPAPRSWALAFADLF
jgi:hypothetical protein